MPPDDEGKQLLAAAESLLKDAKTKFRTAVPAYEKAAKAYKGAIDGKASPEELDFYRDEFDKALEKINDNMSSTQGVLNYVKKMRETGTTDAAKVGAMLKEIAPIRAKLIALAQEGRDLDKTGLKARDEADNSEGELDADLASLKDKVKDMLAKIGDDPLGQAQKLRTDVDKGFDTKKQDTVTKAREKLIELSGKARGLPLLKREVETYKKRLKNDDRDRHREAQYLLDDIFKVESDFPKVNMILQEQIKRGQVPKDEPAGKGGGSGGAKAAAKKLDMSQAKKVADLIGVTDAKLHAKILKALNDCPFAQWAKELAKVTGVKEGDIKSKMAQIEKIPGVRDAKQLIDH